MSATLVNGQLTKLKANQRHKRFRAKCWDNLKCLHCGNPLEDDNLGRLCKPCKHRHKVLTAWKRFYMRLFK